MQLLVAHFRLILIAALCLFFWTSVVSQTGSLEDTELHCSRTSDSNLSQKLRLEAIKHEILLRLGLDEAPPNPDAGSELPTDDPVFMENYRAAQEVQKVYNAHQKPCTRLDTHEKKLLAFFPSSVKGFPPTLHPSQIQNTKHEKGASREIFNEHYRLKFAIDLVDVTSITNVVDYLNAELRLFKQPRVGIVRSRRTRGASQDRVEIRLIERPDNYYNQELPIFITSEILTPESGYAVFNISKAITTWVERNNVLSGVLELDVLIRCPEAIRHGPTFEPSIQFSTDKQTTQLILTVYEEGREKRSPVTPVFAVNNQAKCEFQCCWRPLIVNFRRDYNWTWITQPESIEFNYCSGECPLGWAVDGEHIRFLDIYRRKILDENPTAAPEPCCVPDSYKKELFVLNIKNRTEMVWIDDAVVTSCVCR